MSTAREITRGGNFGGESVMSIVHRAVGVVSAAADATTAAAGAVGGAAVYGIIGGVQGTAAGIRTGLSSGRYSTPAAVLTLAAVGAAGLVDWPVVLAVGGTALVVRQLTRRSGEAAARTPAVSASSSTRRASPAKSTARVSEIPPRKSTGSRRPRTKR
jgi:hypothetical protein